MSRLSLFAFLAMVSTIHAYSAGAPEATCSDMTPKHPVSPQSSTFPYKISVSKDKVKAGDSLEITIGGGEFKGFILQVRKDDKAVGEFLIPAGDKYSKAINCFGAKGSGATHKNATDKKDFKVKWKAPNASGKYTVYATVAKDGGTFWVRQPTVTINVE